MTPDHATAAAVPALPDRVDPATLGRLQLRLRSVLRAPGGHHRARPAEGRRNAGGDSPVQGQPAQSLDSWFGERRHLGTRLSAEEISHGINAGIIRQLMLPHDYFHQMAYQKYFHQNEVSRDAE